MNGGRTASNFQLDIRTCLPYVPLEGRPGAAVLVGCVHARFARELSLTNCEINIWLVYSSSCDTRGVMFEVQTSSQGKQSSCDSALRSSAPSSQRVADQLSLTPQHRPTTHTPTEPHQDVVAHPQLQCAAKCKAVSEPPLCCRHAKQNCQRSTATIQETVPST